MFLSLSITSPFNLISHLPISLPSLCFGVSLRSASLYRRRRRGRSASTTWWWRQWLGGGKIRF